MDLIYAELTYQLRGLLFEVHNTLGKYCNEKQYSDAVENRLKAKKIVYKREFVLPISFEGENEGRNKIDFLINNQLVLEVKAKRIISREDYYQVQRYLHALNKKLALLVNFRSPYLHIKRIINSSAPM
jgi:GxxExxY protein